MYGPCEQSLRLYGFLQYKGPRQIQVVTELLRQTRCYHCYRVNLVYMAFQFGPPIQMSAGLRPV